jgi:hypothetical protein
VLLKADGTPLAHVCLNLLSVAGVSETGSRFFNCSEEDGRFQMDRMPPGEYFLMAEDKIVTNGRTSTSTLYYPGVRDRNSAKVISIAASKYLEGINVKLPTSEARHLLTGRAEFEDGVGAAGAAITFESENRGYKETTQTSGDGSFGLSLVAGMEGQLSVTKAVFDPIRLRSCPQLKVGPKMRGLFRSIDSKPLAIVSDSDQGDLKLVLPSPSCRALP